MVAFFVVGIAFMATSGVQVLIPETGQNGRDWIADVDDAGGLFVVGAWLVVFGGLIGLIASCRAGSASSACSSARSAAGSGSSARSQA